MNRQVDPFSSLPTAFFFGEVSSGFKTDMWGVILIFFFFFVFDVKNAELFFWLPATLIG